MITYLLKIALIRRGRFLGCWSAAIVTVVAMIGTGTARAADEGEIHIKKGVELRRQGRDKEAAEHFRTAYEISHTPRAAAQLALCEQAIGDWLSGELHLSEALLSQSDTWVNSKRATLEAALATGRANLASLKIEGSPQGALISVGDRAVGRLPLSEPIWVQPGNVRVTARSGGYPPKTQDLTVAKGETTSVALNLEKVVAPPSVPTNDESIVASVAKPEANSSPGVGWRPLAMWTAFGLAATSLGVGVVSHVQREGRIGDFNDPSGDCFRDGGEVVGSAQCKTLDDRIKSATTLMWVGYLGAAVLGATSAVLWIGNGAGNQAKTVACRLMPGSSTKGSLAIGGIAECSGRF